MGPQKPKPHFAPPWSLKGEGIILCYKFRASWVEQSAFLTSAQQGCFRGGLGYVMLVNYFESPVGPYKELLLIPGKFNPHRRQVISRIFVDSSASTENGRYNWGIPKETRPITWRSQANYDSICVGDEAAPIFSCDVRSCGFSFPISTRLLPIRLHQELDGATFRTNPHGSGWARWSKVERMTVNPSQFPDISRLKPLLSLRVSPFHLCFPGVNE